MLFSATDDAVMVIDRLLPRADGRRDYRYVAMNPRSQAMFGIGDLAGQSVRDAFPDEDEGWYDLFDQAVETGEVARFEREARSQGMFLQMHLVRVGPPERGRLVVSMRDVTQRRRAEILLQESEVRQRFLLGLSDIMQTLSDEKEIKAAAMTMLGEHLRVSRAQYHECDASGEYYDADGIGYSNGIPLLTDKYRIDDAGKFVNEDFAAGRPFRSDDLQADPRVGDEERAFYRAYQIRAGAGIPLIRAGKLVAILAVHDVHPHPWTDAEMELIRETAERIWTAVERARAEAALRGSEERQALLLGLSDTLLPIRSPRAIEREAMRVLGRHLGVDRARWFDIGASGEPVVSGEGFSRDGLASERDRIDAFGAFVPEALGAGETVFVRDVATDHRVSDDGDRKYRAFLGIPIAKGGRLRAAVGLYHEAARDWTREEIALAQDVAERTWAAVERARAETAHREAEERFAQFAEASAAGLWIRDAGTLAMEFVSPAMGAIYGVEPEALIGDVKHWAATIVPDDRGNALEQLDAARSGEARVYEFRIRRASDASFRFVRHTDFPLLDHGEVRRVGGIAEDITQTRLLAEHQGVLLAELQHRVRNIMGMIRSIANRTAAGAQDVESYRALLEGRLLALARVQALLTRQANSGGALRDIVEKELAAQAHHREQFALTGPDIDLSPKAVEVLTLAFHELATNALKYGALSVPDGRVAVDWTTREKRGAPWLVLDWVENGAPPREPSGRRGFGRELVEARLAYELGGRGEIEIGPEGARCHLEFPLADDESILETDAPQPTTIFGGALDMTDAADLTGRRVLVVEDDFYMAGDTAAALRGAGAEVLGPCPSEPATRDLLEDDTPTHAVLDLNLDGGGPRFEVARLLKERRVPFIFLTGYDPDVIPADMTDIVRLQKPVSLRAVVDAIGRLSS